MPAKESLEQSIEHFRELQTDLIDEISNICKNPREKIISAHYDEIIAKKAKWYIDYCQNTPESQQNVEFLTENASHAKLEPNDYIKLIESNPEEKIKYINDFLSSLHDLDKSDIEIIIENLKTLTMDSLKQEFQNLAQVFTI